MSGSVTVTIPGWKEAPTADVANVFVHAEVSSKDHLRVTVTDKQPNGINLVWTGNGCKLLGNTVLPRDKVDRTLQITVENSPDGKNWKPSIVQQPMPITVGPSMLTILRAQDVQDQKYDDSIIYFRYLMAKQ